MKRITVFGLVFGLTLALTPIVQADDGDQGIVTSVVVEWLTDLFGGGAEGGEGSGETQNSGPMLVPNG